MKSIDERVEGDLPTEDRTPRGRVARLRNVVHGGAWPDHELARETVRGPLFTARDRDGDGDAAALAYQRLHALVGALGPVERLTREIERMAALHEWAVVGDVALCAIATIHANLFAGTVAAAVADGREDLRPLLRELDEGALVGLFLATEEGFGSSVGALQTTATYDSDAGCFTLSTPTVRARKFMPNTTPVAGQRKVGVVLARLVARGEDCGVLPFLVPIADARGGVEPGVAIEPLGHSPGMPLDNAVTSFDEVRVPFEALLLGEDSRSALGRDGGFRSALLARERSGAAMRRVETGRICMTAAAVATLRASAVIALRWSHSRETPAPGRPDVALIAFRSQQRELLGALADGFAMSSLVNAAKRAWEEERADPERARRLHHRVNVTKALATWTAQAGVSACRERCGARGQYAVNRFPDFLGFLRSAITAEGDNLVVLGHTAHAMLTGEGYDALAPVPRPVGEVDLRDPAWWTWIARSAERHSHARAVVRMRDALRRRPADAFEVWNEVLPDALDVARRHAVRLTVEAVVDDAGSLGDGSDEQMALLRLGALWYAREVDRDAAYLAGHGIVPAATLALLPDLVDHLGDRILPDAEWLLDAFAMDEQVLRTPLAQAPPHMRRAQLRLVPAAEPAA